MEIIYRILEPEDSIKYRNLRLESLKLYPKCFGSGYAEQSKLPKLYFERIIEKNCKHSVMLGAFIGTDLVGICGLTPSVKNHAEIIQMYIVKKLRGQSIALNLLEFAKNYITNLNCTSIILTVYKENHQAFNLYQRAGFSISSVEKNEVNMIFVH